MYLPKACVQGIHICSNFKVFLYVFFFFLPIYLLYSSLIWYTKYFLKRGGKEKNAEEREMEEKDRQKIFPKHILSKCINYLHYQITFNFTWDSFM